VILETSILAPEY